ncbi:olfactory receptor 6C2-like [Sus scrofa]|uniref:olfactory receptor 6C2-like n=1 Tax=Sus scrofa TaxID=9823 RepID=UPI000A2B1095|nr:olfactory receptor 6C2-like [Sus scrofa]
MSYDRSVATCKPLHYTSITSSNICQSACTQFLGTWILEISFTTACVPTYLHIISSGDKTITISACFSQIFFIILFGATEFFLLAVMSYDRYVAICKPLHYMSIMNSRVCRNLILCCWVSGLLIILPPFGLSLRLEFCDTVIDQFFCDASPILKNSCSDTWFIEQLIVFSGVLTLIVTLVCVVLSYIYIIGTVLRFPCEVVSLHRLGHWRRVASIFFFGTYALEESRSYVRSSYTLRLPCSGSPSWPETPMITPHLIQPSSL